MRNLFVLAAVGLIVYTIIDVLRSDESERFGVHRVLWLVFIVVLPVIGSLAWLALRRVARSAHQRGDGPPRPRPAAGPVAPDDDPEFLWRLEQQRRRADRDRAAGDPKPEDPRPEV